MHPGYLIGRPVEEAGVERLHTAEGSEQCNRDDMGSDRQSVDEDTAKAMLERGQVVRCAHCKPLEVLEG